MVASENKKHSLKQSIEAYQSLGIFLKNLGYVFFERFSQNKRATLPLLGFMLLKGFTQN